MSSKVIVIYATIILLMAISSFAGSFSLDAYYKSFFTHVNMPYINDKDYNLLSDNPDRGLVTNRLRLSSRYNLSQSFRIEAAYDIVPIVNSVEAIDYSFSNSLESNSLSYRIDDFNRRIYPSLDSPIANFRVNHNLDRLFATFSLPMADILIGRQAIAWGSARVINPTDIIAPYAYEELDTEDRIGVDAVRIRIPIGFMGEIDAGYVAGEDAKYENSATFIRTKYYLAQTDVTAMAVAFRDNLMIGFDLARAIGGAGIWYEGAYVFDHPFDKDKRRKRYEYYRMSVGIDYSLSGKLYGFIEYHFNQEGQKDTKDYWQFVNHPAYTEGVLYLLGQHYIIPGASYQLTPLSTITGQILTNLNDPSAFISLLGEYNIADNVYLSAGAFIGVGEGMKVRGWFGFQPRITARSEFGSYSDVIFTSFKVYF